MLLSGAAFTAMYLLAKELSHYGGFAVTTFRGLGTFVPVLAYLLWRGIGLRGNRPRLLVARALTGAISLALFFVAIEGAPVTAAVAIRYLSPIVAVALIAWRLGEPVRRVQWLLFGLAFAGVVLVKGFDMRISAFALALVLGSAALDGVTFSLIRALGTTEHPLVIVAYFTGAASLLGAVAWGLTLDAHPLPGAGDYARLLAIGLVGLVGQYFMTVAMQTGQASKVMPLKYVEAVYLLIFSAVFLDERYSAGALAGIGLIVVANVANVLVREKAKPM